MIAKPMITTVIFDMDGVISDTQILHASIESRLLAQQGIYLSSDEITRKYASMRDRDLFQKLFQEHGVSASVDDVVAEKWALMQATVQEVLTPIPYALPLVHQLSSEFTLGLASSSPPYFIEYVLKRFSIYDRFTAITSSHEVARSKPDPDVFLLAAEKLQKQPAECAVIEDSHNGMLAAKRAEMKCIGYVAKGVKQEYPADVVVDSLGKVSGEMIKELMKPILRNL